MLENVKLDTRKFNNEMNNIELRMSAIKDDLSISENHLITVESYVEKYLPVRIQANLTDVLSEIFVDVKDQYK